MGEHDRLPWFERGVDLAEDHVEVAQFDAEHRVGDGEVDEGGVAGVADVEAECHVVALLHRQVGRAGAGGARGAIDTGVGGDRQREAGPGERLGDGQVDGGEGDGVLEGPHLAPERLELGFPGGKLAFEGHDVVDVGGLVDEGAKSVDARHRGLDPAAQVDHPLGHVIGGDRLGAELPDLPEGGECLAEPVGRDLEGEDGHRVGGGVGGLTEQVPTKGLDDRGRLDAGTVDVVDGDRHRGRVDDVTAGW